MPELAAQRNVVLRDACGQCLGQCLLVTETLPVAVYRRALGSSSSIGTHMRHIIERVSCVLQGVNDGLVDYDRRARDPALEASRENAEAALRQLLDLLADSDRFAGVTLRVSESVHPDCPAVAVPSTLERELMSLVSHTVHHLAIIVLLARAQGVELPGEVGKAPSTIIFQRGNR